MLAASRSGKTKTLASPVSCEKGKASRSSSSMATSTSISPSISRSGRCLRAMATALRTFSGLGPAALPHHHRAEVVAGQHALARLARRDAAPLPHLVVGGRVLLEEIRLLGLDDLRIAQLVVAHLLDDGADRVGVAEQDWLADPFFLEDLRGLQDLRLISLGEDDAGGPLLRLGEDDAHHLVGAALPFAQFVLVAVEVDVLARRAACHGRFRHRRSDPEQDP